MLRRLWPHRPPLLSWARRVPLLRALAEVAAGLLATRQPVGACGVIVGRDGRVLLAFHRTRPSAPWGLPGGWLHRGELPEDGLLREVEEELALPVTLEGYLCTFEHWNGRFRPRGLSLAFRLATDAPTEEPAAPASWEVAVTRWVTLEEAEALLESADELRAVRLALGAREAALPGSATEGER